MTDLGLDQQKQLLGTIWQLEGWFLQLPNPGKRSVQE